MHRCHKRSVWTATTLLALAGPAIAQQPAPDLPLWEIGLFGGAASTPAYPGADDRSARALVLPLLIYRGKVLRADRSGVGARRSNSGTASSARAWCSSRAWSSRPPTPAASGRPTPMSARCSATPR